MPQVYGFLDWEMGVRPYFSLLKNSSIVIESGTTVADKELTLEGVEVGGEYGGCTWHGEHP